MSNVIHFEQNMALSTPNYNPKLYVLLGHYCGPNQHFIPVINLLDKENPKFRILRLNKDKLMHTIIIDKFENKTITIVNNKGQQTAWTFKDNHALARVIDIIGGRYHGEILKKIKKGPKNDLYKIEFCNELFNRRVRNCNEILMNFVDYIEPGYFCNWHDNQWNNEDVRTKKNFDWPRNEFIKY